MVEAFNSASNAPLSVLRFHYSKFMVFCMVVGVVSLVKMASSASGYWSSARRMES